MRPESSNELRPWQRWTVAGASWSLFLSGVLWLAVHYLWGAGGSGLPHPAEAWLMRWHGLSAPVGLFALGVVAAWHVQGGWRLRLQRASGLSLCALGAALVATGYALAYLVPESWRPGVGWGHAALGALAFGMGAAHARRRPAGMVQPCASTWAHPRSG